MKARQRKPYKFGVLWVPGNFLVDFMYDYGEKVLVVRHGKTDGVFSAHKKDLQENKK